MAPMLTMKKGWRKHQIMTNPKSKSKVQVQTDDWVFIQIGFSNHLATSEKLQRSKIQ